jgi:type II secretory pathway component PulL
MPVEADTPIQWGHWNGERVVETGETLMTHIQALADMSLPVIGVIPGQEVKTLSHELPQMNKRERRKAVLFAIEEQISSPLDTLHAALTDTDAQTVSVVKTSYMENAAAWANGHGLNLKYLIADYDALAGVEANAINLGDRVVLSDHSLDPDWFNGESVILDKTTLFSHIAGQAAEATNLLQGEFAPKNKLGGSYGLWMQLGGLAACLGIAFLAVQGLQARAVKAQADTIRAETSALYARETGQPAPSNPARAVAQAKKNGVITPTEFLTLSDIAFRALEDFDDVRIERITFQDSRSELQLRLIYPSFERAEDVSRAMQSAGGTFVPGGVREQSGRFIGEAVLKLGGAS